MRLIARLHHLLKNFLHQSQVENDLSEEMRSYIDELAERKIQSCANPEAARRKALAELGGISSVSERVREERMGFELESWLKDVHYAFRTFRKNPGFVAIVLLTLALGIGANTALFSVLDAILYRTLPVRNPGQIAMFNWHQRGRGQFYGDYVGITDGGPDERSGWSVSLEAFQQLRAHKETMSDLFAFYPFTDVNVNVDGYPETLSGELVSENYYSTLGVSTAAGRTIVESDLDASAEPVAVISYRYWTRRFSRSVSAIGKRIQINGRPVTIVGVSASDFDGIGGFGKTSDLILPFVAGNPVVNRPIISDPNIWWIRVMGRMKPGVTIAEAQTSLDPIFRNAVEPGRSAKGGPNNAEIHLVATSGSRGFLLTEQEGQTEFRGPAALNFLPVMFGTLLLIVCLNISNLLLARATNREHEIGVRRALGAGRGRIMRQLITENLLLAFIGGTLGAMFAFWGKDLLWTTLNSDGQNRFADLRIDSHAILFSVAISLLTGLIFGIIPAIRGSRLDPHLALKGISSRATKARTPISKALLVVQVSVSVALVILAGLFLQTVLKLESVDVGIDTNGLVLFRVEPGVLKYDGEHNARLYAQIIEKLSAIPGVSAVTRAGAPLVANAGSVGTIFIEGRNHSRGEVHEGSLGSGTWSSYDENEVRLQGVHDNLFDVLGVPMVAGRRMTPADNATAPRVAVINQTLAQKFFAGSNPIGKHFAIGGNGQTEWEIVGIVRDIRLARAQDPTPSTVYISDLQGGQRTAESTYFIVRAAGATASVVAALHEAMRQVDPDLPLIDVKTQKQQIEEAFSTERSITVAANFFGIAALLLASIGLYGVMSYNVTRRIPELGVRIALGARPFDAAWLIQKEMLWVVAVGIVAGLAIEFASVHLIQHLLYGVDAHDASILGFAVCLMIGISLLAGYLPARRAAKIDPMVALRSE